MIEEVKSPLGHRKGAAGRKEGRGLLVEGE